MDDDCVKCKKRLNTHGNQELSNMDYYVIVKITFGIVINLKNWAQK